MIRFVTGLFIIFGAVGAQDFADATHSAPPSIWQTLSLSVLGLALMFWALPKLIKQNG